MQLKIIVGALLPVFLLSACSIKQRGLIDTRASVLNESTTKRIESIMGTQVPLNVSVPGRWLAPKVVELGEDAALPAQFALRNPLALGWIDRANLRTIGERIAKATSIPVRFNPDVFGSNGSGDTTRLALTPATPAATSLSSGLPPPPPSLKGNGVVKPMSVVEASADTMEMSHVGTLAEFLNKTADHFDLNWEYKNGAIYFYRYLTRSFQLNANAGSQGFNSSLGKSNGSKTSEGGSSFDSAGKVELKAEGLSIWDSVEKQLSMIRTPASRCGECGYTISQASGTILIKDTKSVIEQAAAIIKRENTMATQQVAVKVDIYNVTSNDSRELGVNWNAVFQRLTNLTPSVKINLSSPTSLVSPSTGSFGISILEPVTDGSSGLQRISGSQALLQAMEGLTTTYQLDSASAITLNRRLSPIASIDQQSYLQSTTPGNAGSGGGGTALPGLTPGTVTTGLTGFVLPTVLANGSVLLTMGLDSSTLKSIGSVSTGEGATKQLINTPNVGSFSTLPQVVLKPGSTLVLSGRTRDDGTYNQQTLTGQVGLGGSYVGKRERSQIVVMVTVQLLQGG